MIRKRAICALTEVLPLGGGGEGIVRTAAKKIGLDRNPDAKKVVESEIKKHPTALFFKAKAIVADEVNTNGDLWCLHRSYRRLQRIGYSSRDGTKNC